MMVAKGLAMAVGTTQWALRLSDSHCSLPMTTNPSQLHHSNFPLQSPHAGSCDLTVFCCHRNTSTASCSMPRTSRNITGA